MRNSVVVVVRGGVSRCDKGFGLFSDAMDVAKRESLRYPDAKVYCQSSDRELGIVQTLTASNGRLVRISVRYFGKVVTSDDTIPGEKWDMFNEKR